MGNSFLDKGILLGFCFRPDPHHRPCAEYLYQDDLSSFITDQIDQIFRLKKRELADKHETNILKHVSELERSKYDGQLGPMELKEIRRDVLDTRSDTYDFLEYYYSNELPQIISMYELKEQLRELARSMRSLALGRKEEFDEIVNLWVREDEYPEVEDGLQEIREAKEEDMWVCVDAHDLAVRKSGETELGTTDFQDFIRDGRRELILDVTALDDVVGIGMTG